MNSVEQVGQAYVMPVGEAIDIPSPMEQPKRHPQPLPLHKKVRAIALIACISIGVADFDFAAAETVSAPSPYSITQLESGYQQNSDATACPAPGKSDIAAVEKLIGEPVDSAFAKEGKWADKQRAIELMRRTIAAGIVSLVQSTKHHHFSPKIYDEETVRIRKDIAREFHQTVFDPTTIEAEMNNFNAAKTPFSAYLQAAQTYLLQLGVDLHIGTNEELSGSGMVSPKDAQMETAQAKQNLITMVGTFSTFTKEYVAMMGLKTVTLAYKPTGSTRSKQIDKVVAFAGDGNITADITENWNDDLFRHEGDHDLDGQMCGNGTAAENDPAYSALNDGVKYGHNAPNYQDLDSSNQVFNLEDTEDNYQNAGKLVLACNTWRKIQTIFGKAKFFDSWASHGGVIEDKADTGEIVSSPYDWPYITYDPSPTVRKKFDIWFARIYKRNPDVARYYAAVADREFVTTNPCDQIKTGS